MSGEPVERRVAPSGARRRPAASPNHNGGELSFGPDGMLYARARGRRRRRRRRQRPRRGRQRPIARHDARQDPAHRPDALGGTAVHDPVRQPVRQRRRAPGDLGVRPAQPVAVLAGTARPATCGSRTSGRTQWEEVDFVPAGQGAGANFGWNRLEGTHQFSGEAPRRRGPADLRVLARRAAAAPPSAATCTAGRRSPRSSGDLRVQRLLRQHDSCPRGAGRQARRPTRSGCAGQPGRPRSARTRTASCTSCHRATASSASTPPERHSTRGTTAPAIRRVMPAGMALENTAPA